MEVKETYYGSKRDLLWKVKKAYYRGKRDLLCGVSTTPSCSRASLNHALTERRERHTDACQERTTIGQKRPTICGSCTHREERR